MKRPHILLLALSLTACGEPVLTGSSIDTTQPAVPAVSADITPGSKGSQELSGKLVHQIVRQGQSSLSRPVTSAELSLSRTGAAPVKVALQADGSFSLPDNLPDGEYAISALIRSGSFSYTESFPPVRLSGGKPAQSLNLSSRLVALTGKISLESNERATGIEVSVSGLNLSRPANANGEFDLGEVPAVLLKDRELRIQKPNFTTFSQPLGELADRPSDLFELIEQARLYSIVPASMSSVLVRLAGQNALTYAPGPTGSSWPLKPTDSVKPDPGFADGAADQARFNRPGAMVETPAGDLLIADTANHRIRRLSREGQVSTLAGSGQIGRQDGPAAQASFDSPNGLALSPDGSLSISDSATHTIRSLAPDGSVSTLSGGEAGFIDGPLSQARFNRPTDLGRDAAGNLYVLDFGNRAIRKITPFGRVETVYRSDWRLTSVFETLERNWLSQPDFGPLLSQAQGPENARLLYPRNLAVTADGSLYVSDAANFLVFRIRPNSQPEHFAGNSRLYSEGTAAARREQVYFDNPGPLSVDARGTVYLADAYQIYQLPEQGSPFKLAPIESKITGFSAQADYLKENLFTPGALLIHSTGSLTVSDRYNHALHQLHPCTAERPAVCTQPAVYSRGIPEKHYNTGSLSYSYQPPYLSTPDYASDVPTIAPAFEPTTYLLRVENVSPNLRLGSGLVFDSFSEREPLFSEGQPERGVGFEAFAEDNLPDLLHRYFSFPPQDMTPIEPLEPLDFSSKGWESKGLAPGQSLERLVTSTGRLHLNIKLVETNDSFLSFGPKGLLLPPPAKGAITPPMQVWDAGTESNETAGQGAYQPGRQPYINSGSEEKGVVHRDNSLQANTIVKVTLTPLSREQANQRAQQEAERVMSAGSATPIPAAN